VPVPTPCVGICRLLEGRDLCEGCLRSTAEITEWRDADDARRRDILRAVEARRLAMANEASQPPAASSPQWRKRP